eukprot:10153536-Alexandrium_andersonii.AAC.1
MRTIARELRHWTPNTGARALASVCRLIGGINYLAQNGMDVSGDPNRSRGSSGGSDRRSRHGGGGT